MRAEIVSVGTELLLGQIVDTNAAYLARVLSEIGVSVFRRVTVGDNHARLLDALQQALAESDVVVTVGGLGPTEDDITRETLAEAMGDTLERDEATAHRLQAFFRSRGIRMAQSNLKQALKPMHGRLIDNPNGTAPGLIFERELDAFNDAPSGEATPPNPKSEIRNPKSIHTDARPGKIAMALPGPPNEFIPMVDNHVAPYLRAITGGGTIRSRTLRITGMGESSVEEKVLDLTHVDNPTVAPYAKLGEVHLRVTARASDIETAGRMIEERVKLLLERLGNRVYGFDDETLEAATVKLLTNARLTVATAESCTGGLLASRITDVPGSSLVFPGGVVNYSNESKTDLVYVPAEMIAEHGAVSAEVAQALAKGAITRFKSDFGIGITGVAGPDGGTPEKPVGLVYIAVAGADRVKIEKARFIGSRKDIRWRSAQTALTMLRDRVLELGSAS